MIKKVLSIFFACVFVMVSLSYRDGMASSTSITFHLITTQLNQDNNSAIIYRTVMDGTNINKTWNFKYYLVARENGNIHIEIQHTNFCQWSEVIQDIGTIIFNGDMIADIGEYGANGCSIFNRGTSLDSGYCHLIRNYNNTNITYLFNYSTYGLGTPTYLMDLNLYVKEPYLTTNQTINFFGNEIEIPFGEPYIDKDTYIQELEGKISKLENRINELESGSITPYKPGDINGDDIIDATDASSILCYYAYLMTGGDPSIGILDFEEND